MAPSCLPQLPSLAQVSWGSGSSGWGGGWGGMLSRQPQAQNRLFGFPSQRRLHLDVSRSFWQTADKPLSWMVIRHTIQAFTPCLFIVRYILHTEEHVHRVCAVFKIIKWTPVWKERHVLPAPQFPHTVPLPLGKIIVTLMLMTMTPLPLKVQVNASRYALTATAGFCLLADLSEMECVPWCLLFLYSVLCFWDWFIWFIIQL